jgi:uridine phosphorylase
VPARLRPTAPIAADAVLVGDPGRALLLAQELLAEPKMSNHARGLWGYSGRTPAGDELTIQSTGMGGPSAALVLADLAKLGLRRAVRVGTCAAAEPGLEPGAMVVVGEAVSAGAAVSPDPGLTERLRDELGGGPAPARVASLDDPHADPPAGVVAADLQTATLLARGGDLGLTLAAVLIVERSAAGERIADAALEDVAKRAGRAAVASLST